MSGSTNLFCKEATYDIQAMGKGIQKAALPPARGGAGARARLLRRTVRRQAGCGRIGKRFGDPKAAADKIIEESAETASAQGKTVRARTAGDTAARAAAAVLLFLFVGLPLLAVVFCLAVAGAALFLSGFAVILAGVAYVVYFLAQLCMYGGAGYVAQIGIGLATAGVGALLVPLFLCCTKWLFIACGKIFVLTGRVVRGKREAN